MYNNMVFPVQQNNGNKCFQTSLHSMNGLKSHVDVLV